ncbi:serine/threonine protein kinase/ABC-type transport system substrate-binding protein [Streptomyces phaeochromogenes]|uniref:ABC transporter substrate-binding protein n=1 Tax=Streptomyces phaeochromogenes TaxID=1923 RepID=UPI0027940B77|nr:ABC transporter substrate-binding protein [Streptomyces phaeochromogenes]MDQ0947212.1 serine/threonine protein kinase/ABC-type transport system substrate-binding protein [Streptomyces phaeochromogenes]
MRDTVLDGRYTLTERIGAGGMGVVWRARDARLERPVAVKLLSLPPGTAGAERERLLAMFGREARAAAALDSSYIVPVFDHGADGEVPYLVMPLLSGRTVGELLTEGPLPPERVAELAAQVCRALATAHRAGIVHRDIKPANVMLTDEGTVKVLDFGIAKFLDAAAGGRLTATTDSPIGTLPYMAPERFTRGADDGRTDVYALGCTVYEMLTGAPPFDSTSAPALMHSHVYETPEKPSVRRPGLAPQWDELVGRMLAKPVDQRPTAEEARAAFERLALPAPRVPASVETADGVRDRIPPPGQHSGSTAPKRPAHASPEQQHPAPAPAPQQLAAGAATTSPDPTSYLLAPPLPKQPPAPPAARLRGRRATWIAASAVVTALVVVLSVVQPFGGDDGDEGSGKSGPDAPKAGTVAPVAKTQTLTLGSAADAKGPAPAVRGATKGGKVTVLEPGGITTLDPGNMWSGTDRMISRLVYRSLTTLETLPNGSVRLVGDLAEDTGRPSLDGREWTFTLKPGLTYNDGSPVRAQDFAYAVKRALDPDKFPMGDRTLRNFLLGPEDADGIGSEHEMPPGVIETPDDRTIIFHLDGAHPDFNVVLAGPNGAPMPERVADISGTSTLLPSTGPYQVDSFSGAKNLTLTRNPKWRADTDPVRTAYPDRYEVTGSLTLDEIKSRIRTAGSKSAVMTFSGSLDKDGLGTTDGATGSGTVRVTSPAPYVHAYSVDTKRVPKLKVRQAIATAYPAADVLAASGEDGVATHHLMPPGIPGSRDFDLYGAGEHGDPARARALLAEAGETGFALTVAYATTADEARAKAVKKALDKAGFRVTLKNVDVSEIYENVGDGAYDLARLPMNISGLPLASAFLPDSFDGRYTFPTTSNFSRLNSTAVNNAIDEANATADLAAAGEKWSTVDRRVMEQAAAIPVYVPVRTFLYSSRLKGLQVDLDGLSPLNAYVTE